MIISLYYMGLQSIYNANGHLTNLAHVSHGPANFTTWGYYLQGLDINTRKTYEIPYSHGEWTEDTYRRVYNNVLKHNFKLLKEKLSPEDILIFIVNTSQLTGFNEDLKLLGLDTQKKWVLPAARNANYPARVNNPDNGFCLHTFVFELNKEFFNA